MIQVLRHPTFAALFSAQVVALLGTGLLTVALGLLAFDLADGQAGAVLGTALTIKMVAYVVLSPVAQAFFQHLPRRVVLITADVLRAVVAVCLPFVTEIWQIYALIFVLQAASATFTPAFQATIPDVLPDEEEYTRALSLSRLAYDIENLASPALAGLLLTVMSYNWLFLGTVAGFVASALLIWRAQVPVAPNHTAHKPFSERLTRGIRIYLATPRLRGLLALNMTAAATSAFVLVNTVVLVRSYMGGTESDLALTLGAYGAGSMAMALALPRVLDAVRDRPVMITGAFGLAAIAGLLGVLILQGLSWTWLLIGWASLGALYSAVLTPSGRLLRRSAHAEDRPAVFAAQFALSHACWLFTYPMAGWAGAVWGLGPTFILLATVGLLSALLALRVWPSGTTDVVPHGHPDLPPDHPHLRAHRNGRRHAHAFVIDDEHRVWPTNV
ncbi:MFS transporter [Roseovarius rhodophyticola]|uniref:MFS transporter n=1 Tax=Roseovarius rhodophyticola TaxID=3080827 RepID=A0ABZ2TBN4_9RHOB|nr:MFS transporter [Roseovarius sp. W115]MDV2930812.1 MFS transporter [Roseovarius sp. W115]